MRNIKIFTKDKLIENENLVISFQSHESMIEFANFLLKAPESNFHWAQFLEPITASERNDFRVKALIAFNEFDFQKLDIKVMNEDYK